MAFQKLKDAKMILRNGYGNLSAERLEYVEEKMGVKLPCAFIDLLKKCDGGKPTEDFFEILYIDPFDNSKCITSLTNFLAVEDHHGYANIFNHFNAPSEGFSGGLLAFAECGGDRFCFDYRAGKHLKDPPIVYWIQGNEEGKDIAFLANNFEEFIGMFKPEGYYDHMLGGDSEE